jgi:hypothetical protein
MVERCTVQLLRAGEAVFFDEVEWAVPFPHHGRWRRELVRPKLVAGNVVIFFFEFLPRKTYPKQKNRNLQESYVAGAYIYPSFELQIQILQNLTGISISRWVTRFTVSREISENRPRKKSLGLHALPVRARSYLAYLVRGKKIPRAHVLFFLLLLHAQRVKDASNYGSIELRSI